jgi:hypothetical protein
MKKAIVAGVLALSFSFSAHASDRDCHAVSLRALRTPAKPTKEAPEEARTTAKQEKPQEVIAVRSSPDHCKTR